MSAHSDMHAEHKASHQDHAKWLREIGHWRVDHQKSLAILARVTATIHELAAEMEAHASAIRDHHLAISRHERQMVHSEVSGDTTLDETYSHVHDEMDTMHADVALHHAALVTSHNEFMSDMSALFEVLADNE